MSLTGKCLLLTSSQMFSIGVLRGQGTQPLLFCLLCDYLAYIVTDYLFWSILNMCHFSNASLRRVVTFIWTLFCHWVRKQSEQHIIHKLMNTHICCYWGIKFDVECLSVREHDMHLKALWIQFETQMYNVQVGLSQSSQVCGFIPWNRWVIFTVSLQNTETAREYWEKIETTKPHKCHCWQKTRMLNPWNSTTHGFWKTNLNPYLSI